MGIDKLFENTKARAFLYKQAAFLGTLMSRLSFKWDSSIETACASATGLSWNPDWFNKLSPESRVSVLLHELWHVARLHTVRKGTRDPMIWNIACDIRINNDLISDGYMFDDAGGVFNPDMDKPDRLSEEEIYEILIQNQDKIKTLANGFSGNDIEYSLPGSKEEIRTVQIVQSAHEYAKRAGCDTDSAVAELLAKQLKPKVPWRRLLRQYFMDICKEDYSWKRPNRRYEDIYLPSMNDDSKLISLNYYIDTSGSISDEMLIRFNSELRSIWQDLKPGKLRIINFDTQIQSVEEISPDKPYNYFKFTGRGGTDLKPVMEHISKTKPVAAIIFSDLYCKLPAEAPNVPVIWVIVDNKINPSFGKSVHLEQKELIDGSK